MGAGAPVALGVLFQRTELLREGDLLVFGEILIAECQQLMVKEGLVNRVPGLRIEGLREIQTNDFRCHQLGQRPDHEVLAHTHCRVGHRLLPSVIQIVSVLIHAKFNPLNFAIRTLAQQGFHRILSFLATLIDRHRLRRLALPEPVRVLVRHLPERILDAEVLRGVRRPIGMP